MLHDSCVSHQKTVEELTLSICPGSRERDPDNTTQKGVSFFLSVARAPPSGSYDPPEWPANASSEALLSVPRAEPPKPTFGHSVLYVPSNSHTHTDAALAEADPRCEPAKTVDPIQDRTAAVLAVGFPTTLIASRSNTIPSDSATARSQ